MSHLFAIKFPYNLALKWESVGKAWFIAANCESVINVEKKSKKVIVAIGSKLDNMINIKCSYVMGQNKNNVTWLLVIIFCTPLSLNEFWILSPPQALCREKANAGCFPGYNNT